MTMPDATMLTIREAATYLGYSAANIRYHLYVSHKLAPDGKFGHSVYFTRATLDAFYREPSHCGKATPTALHAQTQVWLLAHATPDADPHALALECAQMLNHPRWVRSGPPLWLQRAAAQAITEAQAATV